MDQNIEAFYGRKLGALDGEIGHVKDFYFDDQSWTIRYVVADTGSWLTGRLVLLPRHVFGAEAFGKHEPEGSPLQVNLTRAQIEGSPSIDTHRPVSRQAETEYYSYFGWLPYWEDSGLASALGVMTGAPAVKLPTPPEAKRHHGHNQRDDLHLQSMKAVTGYHLQATDGKIGTVKSFLVDDTSWAIRELVVETGHWYAGKPIQVRTENVTGLNREDSTVSVNLRTAEIRRTSEDGVARQGAGTVAS